MRRLELRAGKMSTVDFFDLNSAGSDSHLQFMNWTSVNNGTFDYAADTRGYTYGFLAEFYDDKLAARFGEMLMPTVANGIVLDWDLARARGENYELEYHTTFLPKRSTLVRGLAFENHANMGRYREAIDGYLSGKDSVPDITPYRKQGRVKYGFGLNGEQELTHLWRAFFRLGWNDGHAESFAYTEVDRTAEFGSDFRGSLWHRPLDKVGAAVPTVFPATTAAISNSEAKDSSSATAACATAWKRFSKLTTPPTSGAASPWRSTISTSPTPATTATAALPPSSASACASKTRSPSTSSAEAAANSPCNGAMVGVRIKGE
jgi:hypothetical protein